MAYFDPTKDPRALEILAHLITIENLQSELGKPMLIEDFRFLGTKLKSNFYGINLLGFLTFIFAKQRHGHVLLKTYIEANKGIDVLINTPQGPFNPAAIFTNFVLEGEAAGYVQKIRDTLQNYSQCVNHTPLLIAVNHCTDKTIYNIIQSLISHGADFNADSGQEGTFMDILVTLEMMSPEKIRTIKWIIDETKKRQVALKITSQTTLHHDFITAKYGNVLPLPSYDAPLAPDALFARPPMMPGMAMPGAPAMAMPGPAAAVAGGPPPLRRSTPPQRHSDEFKPDDHLPPPPPPPREKGNFVFIEGSWVKIT